MLTTADQTPRLKKACWEDDPAHNSNNLMKIKIV